MIRLSAPLDVQIELTELCNQKCFHCYNYWRHASSATKKELDADAFINIIKQLCMAKVGLVTFTGGEPLIRKKVLFQLVETVNELGLETGLNTNAALLTNDDAHKLSGCGLDHALVSVLGPKKVHNRIAGVGADFNATINGIQYLQKADIGVSINMVVSKVNLSEMFATAEAMRKLGVHNFCAGPCLPSCSGNIPLCLSGEECKRCLRELMRIGRELSMNIDVLEPIPRCLFNEEDEAEFVRFFGNRICSAAVSSCAISSTGMMRPCIHSDATFGSVLPDNFLGVWNKMAEWASPDILPQECRSCNALMSCEGGCRMSAKVTSGRYDGPDMYMTGAISDPKRATLLPIDGPGELLGAMDLLEFNKRCILRQEQNGYIAYLNGKLEHLTQKGFDFVSTLSSLGPFSSALLSEKLEFSEEVVRPVLSRLVKARILTRKEF